MVKYVHVGHLDGQSMFPGRSTRIPSMIPGKSTILSSIIGKLLRLKGMLVGKSNRFSKFVFL